MIEKYVCIKKVSLINENDYDIINYKKYFVINNVYEFINPNLIDELDEHIFQYTHSSEKGGYHFTHKEMNDFFIKKSIIDREKIINKILKDD